MYNLPKWSSEFVRFLTVTPQFAFSGNILDVYPVEIEGNLTTLRLKDYLRTILAKEGYEIILALDPFAGFSHLHGDPDTIHAVLGDVLTVERAGPPSLERTLEILLKSVDNRTAYSAIILNQIIRHDDRYSSSDRFLYQLFCISQNAEPRLLAGSSCPRYNLLIWIHDRDVYMPPWYIRDNTRVRQIVVPRPDLNTRRDLLESLTKSVPQFEEMDETARNDALALFVKKTYNLQANEIISLISLVRRDILSVSDLAETVIQYSSGIADNFWKTVDRKKIVHAEEFLSSHVFGQTHAIRKVCNIINQSYLGLARSQYPHNRTHPRGFLLLAGHEGVGKSTLARALKNLLSGPDHDMITINMNDYQDEQSCNRLVTFSAMDNGNFLAKINKNPYSILLFENIESAHPLILKLITTIIRDGEIFTNEGNIISFSGCLVMCTLRLQGCCPEAYQHNRKDDETIKEYQTRERTAGEIIAQFYEEQKNLDFSQFIRGNTIIFRSIYPNAAKKILQSMLHRVFEKIFSKYHVMIEMTPSVQEQVEEFCCQDLTRGGISIGQRLETILINPLSHILIEESFSPDEKVIITQISDSESGWELNFSRMH